MVEKAKKKSIELLPPKKFEEYPFTKKLTTWIINIGRIIIVTTELIAFSVFIGRIKLDRELTDLIDALENQLIVLKNAEGFEKEFKDLQERLKIIKELRQNQVPAGKTITFLSALLSPKVTLTSLTFRPPTRGGSGADENNIYLAAKTDSATAFAQTIQQLKSSKRIKEIVLTSGRFSAKDKTYHFSLTIKVGGF